jgi:hypothetical protein
MGFGDSGRLPILCPTVPIWISLQMGKCSSMGRPPSTNMPTGRVRLRVYHRCAEGTVSSPNIRGPTPHTHAHTRRQVKPGLRPARLLTPASGVFGSVYRGIYDGASRQAFGQAGSGIPAAFAHLGYGALVAAGRCYLGNRRPNRPPARHCGDASGVRAEVWPLGLKRRPPKISRERLTNLPRLAYTIRFQ